MPIISIRDLVVEYDGRRILDGINLDIEHGETMVLLGGSGSGKSTLLRQILALERPKSGSVHVKGIEITRCSAAELKNRPALHRRGVSKRGIVQFAIGRGQRRPHPARTHPARAFHH